MILGLPNELLELIFLPLDKRDLWALTRVSYRIRSLTLFPFLARYNLSEKQIRSGALSIPAESVFLVVVAAHIHPLRKLEVLRGRFARDGPGILPAVLAAVPSISDIVVHNSFGQFTNRAGMAQIVAASCQSSTPTLAFVGRGTVTVSTHRNIRPMYLKSPPHPMIRTASVFTLHNLIRDVLSLASVAVAYLIFGLLNIGVAAACMYRHACGVRWDLKDRIKADAGEVHAHWMHVQCLLAGTSEQFTLVTFGSPNDECLTIPRLSSLTDDQRSTLLTALEVPRYLQKLSIAEGANAPLAEVMDCVRRHPQLTELEFEARSVLPASVGDLPANAAGKVTALTAPVGYIPSVLQAEPNVHHLSITFPTPSRGHGAFDLPTGLDALTALAALPGTHPLSLSLSFTKASVAARALPWHFQAPTKPLPRITSLTLCTDGAPGAAVDIELLAGWLTSCFPALTCLGAPDVGEAPAVEEALWEARKYKALQAAASSA